MLLVGVLLVGLLPACHPDPSAVEGATRPHASSSPATGALDLAAMTLVPTDLAEPGFALAGAGRVELAEEAERLARARGEWRTVEVVALRDALAAAGWLRRYESRLAAPQEEDSDRFAAVVRSAVAEHADAAGAAAAFALAASQGAAAGRDLPGLIPLGDESRITRTFVPAAGGERPARQLELTFRRGNLAASVAMTDFTDEREWGIVAVERLAAALLARVEAVRAGAGAGLEPRLLRLELAEQPPAAFDVYDRRDGETFPLYGVDPEDAADREHLYGAATDVYTYETFVATGRVHDATPYYAVKLYRFADAATAATWLAGAPERLFADPGSFVDLSEVDEAATIGEESRTVAYGFPVTDVVHTHGYRIYARVGREVARVQLDGEPEVPLPVVEALARAQVACLAGTAACPARAPVPPALVDSGTPVAAP